MNDWGEQLGDRGKAMIAMVVVPLLLPAVLGSFHVIRLWADTEQLNPSITAYYDLIQQADQALDSLDGTVSEEQSDAEWEAAMEKRRRERAAEEASARQAQALTPDQETPKEGPRPFMLGDLELQGIFWVERQPIVYVNHKLVELNEEVNGWRVTYIGKDTMRVTDPEGNEKTYDMDMVLQQLYPSYRRP